MLYHSVWSTIISIEYSIMAGFLLFIFALVAGVAFYAVQYQDPTLKGDIKVVKYNKDVEDLLINYQTVIGSDLEAYRNHIYRVLTYSLHILGNDETYLPLIATALVYHDIGLWTDHTLAYLEPSSHRATEGTKNTLLPDDVLLIQNIVYYHHKITPFEGPRAAVVNAVRRADWIDATQGAVHQGMPKANIKKVYDEIPAAGFYECLQGFGPKLYGTDYWRIVSEMVSILKW